jgi:hypothetical protein
VVRTRVVEMNRHRFLTIAVLGFATALGVHLLSHKNRQSRSIGIAITAPAYAVPAISRALRPDYPYSVIPGGAYSPSELRYANENDRLVREHYAGFNLGAARLVTLSEDRDQYVSFRLRDQIYWTRNKLHIPRGEILLTDGRNYARTRCGNRLSNTPQANTTVQQPSSRLLSLPPFRPELLSIHEVQLAQTAPKGELEQEFPVLPFAMSAFAPYLPPVIQTIPEAPPSSSGFEGDPSSIPTGLGYIPTTGPSSSGTPTGPIWPPVFISSPPPVISEVPEPASLYLFGFAFCVSSWCLTRMMRPDKTSQAGSRSEEA